MITSENINICALFIRGHLIDQLVNTAQNASLSLQVFIGHLLIILGARALILNRNSLSLHGV